MKKQNAALFAGLVGATAAAAVVYARLVRPWHLNWGATPEEARRALPGDYIIPNPLVTATHAITILAPVEKVWQWVVQIGQGRGGFYSYDWLENLSGLDIHSTNRIQPELQSPRVGDLIPFWEGGGIPIVQIEPPHLLVLGGSFIPEKAEGGSWVFVLSEPTPESTRLLVRTQVAGFMHPWLSLLFSRLLLEPVHFIMERRMLLGIKERAEN